MTIETDFDSNYRKVLVAARRARQLQSGSHALVASQSNKPCRIAQEEIDGREDRLRQDRRAGGEAAGGRPQRSHPELETAGASFDCARLSSCVFVSCVGRNSVGLPSIPQENAEWIGHGSR